MLTYRQKEGALRHAGNLLPLDNGGMASRPSAIQVIKGPITGAVDWDDLILVNKDGRIQLWNGDQSELGENNLIDIAPAGSELSGTSFQALTGNAQREDRFYVGDGVNPLWYINRNGDDFQVNQITNTIKDSNGITYPVPSRIKGLTTWQGRLWAIDGTNRAQHCQFEKPNEWDPLWTIEAQGKKFDYINDIEAFGETLIMGLGKSLFAVSGTSQYNWKKDPLTGYGSYGPASMAVAGSSFYSFGKEGIHKLGDDDPVSDDFSEWFHSNSFGQMVHDTRHGLLWALSGGRLLVLNPRTKRFGEIAVEAWGLIKTTNHIGWYGPDGLWLLSTRDIPDRDYDGVAIDVNSRFDTWEIRPNRNGNGRSLLNRILIEVNGSRRGKATYNCYADSELEYTDTVTLSDEDPAVWADVIAGLDGEPWPTAPVQREIVPNVGASRFRHVIEAPVHMEILSFDPVYHYRKPREE